MFINPEIIASSFMTALVIENKSYNELNKTQDSIRILPKLGKLKTEKKRKKGKILGMMKIHWWYRFDHFFKHCQGSGSYGLLY